MKASGSLPPDDPHYAPGLHRRPRSGGEARYWLPPAKDVAKGYRPKSLTLPNELTELELAAQCRRLWEGLLAWRIDKPKTTEYSIAWLVDRYLTDEQSPYQQRGHRAQRSYAYLCKIIRHNIGERLIPPDGSRPRILGEDIRKWHQKWSEPAQIGGGVEGHAGRRNAPEEHGTRPVPNRCAEVVKRLAKQPASTLTGLPGQAGTQALPANLKPRLARARHLIVQFRQLISYAIELGVPGALELRMMLKVMRFPTPEARSVAPTREQVQAFVDKAIEAGRPSLAGVSLAQFWFIERRAHIIGSYVRQPNTGLQWRPGWIWSDIGDDWTITYHQTKTGKVLRVYDLKTVGALLAIVQAIPMERRVGAVWRDEKTGEPWRDRHYAEVFREIATAAGWPDTLKSMDLRAGGATDADAAGVSDRELQDAGGWRDPKTKDRYRRNKQRNAQNVVELRQKRET